jgi:hypothetical protein
MSNHQQLFDGCETSFEVIGFAENLQGSGIRLNELGITEARQAYAAAGEYLDDCMQSGSEITDGDLLFYDMRTNQWATLRLVLADIVSIQHIADLM